MNRTITRSTRPQTITHTRTKVNKGYLAKPHAINSDIVTTSYFVGKGITLFTMFYSSLNWMMYRGMNKGDAAHDERKDNKHTNDEVEDE